MVYRSGDLVEVCSKEEGFVGSYYAAKLLFTAGKEEFLVEYKTLLTNDKKGVLREVVHMSEVRPSPPEIRVVDFGMFDQVDAYDNDGWWVGRVVSINKSNYYVYFECSREEIKYPFSRLRLHQEWKNGEWGF